MKKSKTTKQLERMFNSLKISEEYCFADFLLGELNDLKWLLKDPEQETFRKVKGEFVKYKIRPRFTFKGKQDYLHRQLYRHFISDNIKRTKLYPTNGEDNYNPHHWKKGKQKPVKPISINTPPKTIDSELQDLVDEIKRRKLRGETNVWEGVEELFTPLEIAQAKELIDAEIPES